MVDIRYIWATVKNRMSNRKQLEFGDVPGVHSFHTRNLSEGFNIDEQTSVDLDLASFDTAYNDTVTSYGDQIFYHLLHSQPRSLEVAQARANDLKSLMAHPENIHSLAKLLARIGKQYRGNVVADLWAGLRYRPTLSRAVPFWFFISPALALAALLLLAVDGLFVVAGILIINLVLFVVTNPRIGRCSGSLHYLIKGIRFLRKVDKNSGLSHLHHEWVNKSSLASILKFGFLFKDGIGGASSQDIFSIMIDYLRTFFCAEIFAYYFVSTRIDQNVDEIRQILERIGYIDCLATSVRLLNRNDAVSIPSFQHHHGVRFTDLRHPLVDGCVGQSLHISRGQIITGMNMAGKSTYLRSVAINQILAMSFSIVFAKDYTTDAYMVVTSMRIEDDAGAKKSKYYVEAERLLLIQELLRKGVLMCLIDEILTGTNTEDRVNASIGLLANYSVHSDSIIIAATHDNVIAEQLGAKYDCYYFDGELEGEEIVYDYALKKGIVSKRNAIQLLRYLGLGIDRMPVN